MYKIGQEGVGCKAFALANGKLEAAFCFLHACFHWFTSPRTSAFSETLISVLKGKGNTISSYFLALDLSRAACDKVCVCKKYFLILCLREKGTRGVGIIFVKWKCFLRGACVSKASAKKIVLAFRVSEIKYFESENLYHIQRLWLLGQFARL